MSRRILIEDPQKWDHNAAVVERYDNVIGHVLVAVVKKSDGGLDVERVVGVNADSVEDSQIVGDFIKQVNDKISDLFSQKEEPTLAHQILWIPG